MELASLKAFLRSFSENLTKILVSEKYLIEFRAMKIENSIR